MAQVFVLCSGRCGSTTFTRACEHLTNFSASHESRTAKLGDDRLDYPDNHVEIDNRLIWYSGRMQEKFGDKPYYVHLLRRESEVAASYAARYRYSRGIMKAWHKAVRLDPTERFYQRNVPVIESAQDMVRALNENIRLFLRDKTQVMTIDIADINDAFPRFWSWIGGQGDLDAAMKEWNVRHNAGPATKHG